MFFIEKVLKKFKYVKYLLYEIDRLSNNLSIERDKYRAAYVPPGHFYSPIPSLQEIRTHENKIFNVIPHNILSVDLNEFEQVGLIEIFAKYYKELPYHLDKNIYDIMIDMKNRYYSLNSDDEQKRNIISSYQEILANKEKMNLRYFYENTSFGLADAIALFCMIRHVKPRKIIEIGSGYSSCLMLDVNELFFNNSIQCTFVDPYPESILSLIHNEDKQKIQIVQDRVQDLDIDIFSSLERNDILFIDSTHVSKVGSDVNHIIFNILPSLQREVFIHFHDIFYPFEYPKEWIYEGRSWNECYILRAFLQYNLSFKIIFYSSFMKCFYENLLKTNMPLFTTDSGGSFWIQKK